MLDVPEGVVWVRGGFEAVIFYLGIFVTKGGLKILEGVS